MLYERALKIAIFREIRQAIAWPTVTDEGRSGTKCSTCRFVMVFLRHVVSSFRYGVSSFQ